MASAELEGVPRRCAIAQRSALNVEVDTCLPALSMAPGDDQVVGEQLVLGAVESCSSFRRHGYRIAHGRRHDYSIDLRIEQGLQWDKKRRGRSRSREPG